MMHGSRTGSKLGFAFAGVLLLLIAAFLPTGWYHSIARSPETPPLPFSGVNLLRLMFAVQGAVLLWISRRPLAFQSIGARDLLAIGPIRSEAELMSEASSRRLLVLITALALGLRLVGLGSDLWLDEIATLFDYLHLPAVQIVGSYLRPNNHLLNTLLEKAFVGLFGESEWVVRLPAMLFGTATVPLLYWVSRHALSRAESLAAALLLATSYHHVFFSQNARGYTAYLFFALASSGLFVRALTTDRATSWVGYVVALFLGFASLINTAFVGVAHAVVGGAAAFSVRRRGGSAAPLLRRLTWVFLTAAFLSVQLYAAAFPELYVVITSVYASPATGFSPWSAEFLREIVRGVGAGFGPGVWLAALPFLAAAVVSYGSLLRRHWLLTLALTLPGVFTALFLAVRGLTFSPRFFLLWLPLVVMSAARGIWIAAEFAARRLHRASNSATPPTWRKDLYAGAVLFMLAGISLLALRNYYRIPKQSYRAAVRHIEAIRESEDRVVVLYTAELGFRYYLARTGTDTSAYYFARSESRFDSVRTAPRGGRVLVVTTFLRGLRSDLPALHAIIEGGWVPIRTFPATIGDGEITIWREKD